MTEVVLGVDVGGTTIAAGLVTPDGEVLFEERAPTHRAGPATAGRTLAELVAALVARGEGEGLEVAGIGVGVPAVVDAVTGQLGDEASHIQDLAGAPLAAMLTRRFGLRTVVDNDVNALALAEWRFGAGRGARSLVVLAPGTGLGSGIVLDGRLVRGAHGFAGELGHVPVKFDGPRCWCGGRGCLALYASGRGIAEAARASLVGPRGEALRRAAGGEPDALTVALVFELATTGDPVAAGIVEQACRALGAMIGVIVNGLNPEVLVITGGVAAAYQTLEPTVLRCAGEYAFNRALARTRVCILPGDKRVTMRGAAALFMYEAFPAPDDRL